MSEEPCHPPDGEGRLALAGHAQHATAIRGPRRAAADLHVPAHQQGPRQLQRATGGRHAGPVACGAGGGAGGRAGQRGVDARQCGRSRRDSEPPANDVELPGHRSRAAAWPEAAARSPQDGQVMACVHPRARPCCASPEVMLFIRVDHCTGSAATPASTSTDCGRGASRTSCEEAGRTAGGGGQWVCGGTPAP